MCVISTCSNRWRRTKLASSDLLLGRDSKALSVIIPTFNRKDSLAVTLEGLKKQTYPNDLFEVVVVSDGSTDGTEEMVRRMATECSFEVKFIQQNNAGPSSARNRAIKEASKDVIVFLDDDVEPVPEFLISHAQWHEHDDRMGVIGPLSPDPNCHSSEPPWITWEHEKLERTYQYFRHRGELDSTFAAPQHFYSGNASIAKKWLLDVDGFDLRYTRQEDVELAVRLHDKCAIRFVLDFSAIGIHRPARSFQSWLNIPGAYGRLDAQRVVDGTVEYASIFENLKNRHALSTFVAATATRGPFQAEIAITIIKQIALVLSACRVRSVAMIALSGLYNVAYLNEFKREYARLTGSQYGGVLSR
jgi:glycosyltransferase involved in cell wall biosynthesis